MAKMNERLIQARQKRFWTQQEAAARIGVSFQTYIRWEHGTQLPHLKTLALLCATFGMTAEELGFGELVGTMRSTAPRYASCFLSHSSMDQSFVERLYTDLQNAGVRCWYAPAEIKIGDNFPRKIEEAILTYDKFLLVLSENSISSSAVENEVEMALRGEKNQISDTVYPIRLDNSIWQYEVGWLRHIVQTRHIGDFTRWREHSGYHKSLNQLLRSLLLKKRDASSQELNESPRFQ